jgi:hypothetical protein
MRRSSIRVLAVGCVAVVLVTIGWFALARPDDELAADDDHYYSAPLWAADGWIYLLSTFEDSESWPILKRVRPGHGIVDVPVDVPGCAADSSYIDGLFPLHDEGLLGLAASCDEPDSPVSVLAYSLKTRTATVLGEYRHRGDYSLSWRGDGAIYDAVSRFGPCGDAAGIVEIRSESETCLRGHGRLPVAQPGDVLDFVAESCSLDTPAGSGETICRWERSTNTSVPVMEGFTSVQGFATHASGRLVISGKRDGQAGLWLADPGRPVRRIADEYLLDPALSPDGRTIVAVRNTYRSLPVIGKKSTILVLPVPP